ncbi:TPM domain-containing protein [Pelagerythrobacter marensis]|uniref:Membrane protein n=1 Tax=Pelagerythrobacter marensis TaxID=543877 RepID=A0A0G3X8F8_9SPHN|nr:membrane protein [Pelagerythrobacter marensis]AKM07835.1 Membrane protein [Pelagerythrobacter marensis]
MGYLDANGHRTVTDAVAAAELETSGEIVTVIGDRSDEYNDIALLWAIAAAFTAMSVLALFPKFFLGLIDALMGGWTHEWTPGELFGILTAVGLLKFAGVWAIQLWQPLKFALVPGPVKSARVHAKAVKLFKVGAERRTHGRTGVLIYLSMREHRAEIVADQPIAEIVPAEVWGEAMADMLAEIRKGCVAEGMAAGVRDVGKVLSGEFPRAEDDQNELPDRLIEV